MMKAGSVSVGSMDVFEAEDKSFSKHILTKGEGDTTPNEGSVCMVHITPVDDLEIEEELLGGYVFNENVEVILGEGDTLLSELLDSCIESMKEGERAYIKTKVDAKGNKIKELDIKKNNLKFNIALISVSRAADIEDLELDEKLERGQDHKTKGAELYIKGNYDFAVKRFNRALKYCLDEEDSGESEFPREIIEAGKSLRLACFLNLAACYLKKEMYKEVIANCGLTLDIQSESVKALFRRGQAYLKLHEYDKAKADFLKAREIEPGNKAVASQLQVVQTFIKKEKDMFKKMFK